MTRRRQVATFVVLLALGAIALDRSGLDAFEAGASGPRAVAAEVVTSGAAYHAVAVASPYLSASTTLGYASLVGLSVTNNGAEAATFTFTITNDPDAVVSAVETCAPGTSVGATCAVRLTGPALPAGTYAATGRLDGARAGSGALASRIPGLTISIVYCETPPC